MLFMLLQRSLRQYYMYRILCVALCKQALYVLLTLVAYSAVPIWWLHAWRCLLYHAELCAGCRAMPSCHDNRS